ncbi:MAG: GerW family sporulation protein, partial [Oscillospiraceae bacterium]
ALTKLKEIIDVNTIIGNPITTPDLSTTIIPVSKVGFGYGSGGSDFPAKVATNPLFGGATGGGVSIEPIAFIIIKDGDVKLLQLDNSKDSVDRLVSLIPDVVEKLKEILGSLKKEKDNTQQTM